MNRQGPFVIVSGPSGVGKTLFLKKSLKAFPRFSNTISWTTRPPRTGETNGEFYHFITKAEFEKLKKEGAFLEWAEVHKNFYATAKQEVERLWKEGKAILKDIDVQGCRSIKTIYPESASIFIFPPSLQELKKRLLKRGDLEEQEIKNRLSKATEEMAQAREYDFKIVNDSFEEAWEDFQSILKNYLDKY